MTQNVQNLRLTRSFGFRQSCARYIFIPLIIGPVLKITLKQGPGIIAANLSKSLTVKATNEYATLAFFLIKRVQSTGNQLCGDCKSYSGYHCQNRTMQVLKFACPISGSVEQVQGVTCLDDMLLIWVDDVSLLFAAPQLYLFQLMGVSCHQYKTNSMIELA